MTTIDYFKELLPLDQLHSICESDKANLEDPELYLHTGKYVTKMDMYLKEKVDISNVLKLSEQKNLKIIDIGSGIGIFPWVCKVLGHQCDHTYYDSFKMYEQSWELLGLDKPTYLDITNTGKWTLPSNNYDVIVSTRTVFDRISRQWSNKQWLVFLRTSYYHLNDNGVVFIKSNYLKPHPRCRSLKGYSVKGFDSWTFMITKEQIHKIINNI